MLPAYASFSFKTVYIYRNSGNYPQSCPLLKMELIKKQVDG
jgi:hypothetical protein